MSDEQSVYMGLQVPIEIGISDSSVVHGFLIVSISNKRVKKLRNLKKLHYLGISEH